MIRSSDLRRLVSLTEERFRLKEIDERQAILELFDLLKETVDAIGSLEDEDD